MSERDVEWFRYGSGSRALTQLPRALLLLGYFGVPAALCALSFGPTPWLRILFLLALPLIVMSGVPVVAALVTSADIGLDRDAVRLHVVGPWVIDIPWEALRYAAIWEASPPSHVNAVLARRWGQVHLVHVPGLRVLAPVGIFYGLGRSPTFVVTPDHERSRQLVERLKHSQHPLRRGTQRSKPWRAPDRKLD